MSEQGVNPLLGHADAPRGGDAGGDGGGRGRRRAARPRPDRERAAASGSPSCSGTRQALFLPSGSMCNQIAIRLHIAPAAATRSTCTATRTRSTPRPAAPRRSRGAMLWPLDGEAGMFSGATLEAALRDPDDRHAAALAPGLRRADDEHGRRPRLAAGRDRGGARGRRAARAAHPPRRRPAAQRDGRLGRDAGGFRRRLRHRLDRLQQGPRRARSAPAWRARPS